MLWQHVQGKVIMGGELYWLFIYQFTSLSNIFHWYAVICQCYEKFWLGWKIDPPPSFGEGGGEGLTLNVETTGVEFIQELIANWTWSWNSDQFVICQVKNINLYAFKRMFNSTYHVLVVMKAYLFSSSNIRPSILKHLKIKTLFVKIITSNRYYQQ